MISRVGGPARRAALQPGDVVLMVGRARVKNSADFQVAVKDVKPGDSVMLLVRRAEVNSFIAINVPKKAS